MPNEEVTPYVPPAQPEPGPFVPVDNLQAKRERQALIDRAFTREQQKAIGLILETWWGMKMAGIETQKIAEVLAGVADVNQLRAEVEALKDRLARLEQRPGPRALPEPRGIPGDF